MVHNQSVAIFIAILGLVSLSSGFSLIVVMVLYIEREFVLYIDGFVLIVEGFGLFFFILFWCVSRQQQGDRPSSIFFTYGLDPLLIWLEKRLRGIPIYTMDMFNAPTTTETFKVEAYVGVVG